MEYSIGDVSSLLNVSRDMIRYYEKQGAIKASRNTSNNYRYYDSMEVFWLLEAMQHKSWGIPISEISDIRKKEYSYNTELFLRQESVRIREESIYKKMLSERLEELRRYMLLGMRNLGNFWVDQCGAQYRTHFVRGIGDEYERLGIAPDSSRCLLSERCMPFFDNGLTTGEGYIDWELTIRKKYADYLIESLPESFYLLPEEISICTVVDIGEIGHFDSGSFEVLREYAKSRGYRIPQDSPIRGTLLGRGYEEGKFHRIVKLSLPIC